jgi:hypothetical protein
MLTFHLLLSFPAALCISEINSIHRNIVISFSVFKEEEEEKEEEDGGRWVVAVASSSSSCYFHHFQKRKYRSGDLPANLMLFPK